jgi:arginase
MKREVAVLDAPSNLGLRPPAPGVVPGCYKLAGALRDCELILRLGATDAGCVTPPRYDRHDWRPGDGVANAAGLVDYTPHLADRIGALLDADKLVLVLGGDCSILLGATLALHRRGRYGLAFLDGHSDFRHPGNSSGVGSAAGEDLALVTGRGQQNLTELEGYGPYVRDEDVVVIGIRDDDEYLEELRALGISTWPVAGLREEGVEAAAGAAAAKLERREMDGFWIHVDADILDPALMPAVDSPDPGGFDHGELVSLLAVLLASPRCVGLEVTVFDPDLDPDGRLAGELTDSLVAAFEAVPARRSRVGGLNPSPSGSGETSKRH